MWTYLFLGLFGVVAIIGVSILLFLQFFVSSMDQIEGAAPFFEKDASLTCYHCGKETVASRKTCQHCGHELQ
jgi:hypothetical protein